MLDTIDWSEIKQWNDKIWILYSAYGAPFLGIAILYKFLFPIFWQDKTQYKQYPHLLEDKLLRPFIFYAPFYYSVDNIISILSGKWLKDVCSFAFFGHHLVCIIFLPFGIWAKYVPWFGVIIGFTHAILLWFTQYPNLQYIYLGSIFLQHYGYRQYPFNQMLWGKMVDIGNWILYAMLVIMWLQECHHEEITN